MPVQSFTSHRHPVFLVSGLPIKKQHSFSRQLCLLATALGLQGWHAQLTGPDEQDLSTRWFLEQNRAYKHPSWILLGYPDQFPFLKAVQNKNRVFLWTQCSKPFRPIHCCTYVPITYMSRMFLTSGNMPNISPVVPHGVDTRVFAPVEGNGGAKYIAARAPVIGSVGANSTRKRFDVLIETFRRIHIKSPGARLIVKTDRQKSIGGYDLPGMLTTTRLSDAVDVVVGEMSEQEMANLYRSMDVYLHTAEWEGFCLPVLEAMSCGIPVVTTPIQGPTEILPYYETTAWKSAILRDGETVLREGNPQELASLTLDLIASENLRKRFGEKGSEMAQKEFDINEVAKKWTQTMLKPPKSPSPR